MALETYDLVVVGAGMTGAGVALDAASRGLRVALIDGGDIASGTSSKSSKMVHGGLRYLQQKEFRLVYENLRERQRLLDNAPFLVRPLPFLVPLFGRNGVASKALVKGYATALRIYDLSGGWRIGHRHRKITREQARLPAFRWNDSHVAVGVIEEWLAIGCGVGDFLAIGRPLGVAAGTGGIQQLFHMEVRQIQHVHSLGIARAEIWIARRAEGNALAVGRPGKRLDAEGAAPGGRL